MGFNLQAVCFRNSILDENTHFHMCSFVLVSLGILDRCLISMRPRCLYLLGGSSEFLF